MAFDSCEVLGDGFTSPKVMEEAGPRSAAGGSGSIFLAAWAHPL